MKPIYLLGIGTADAQYSMNQADAAEMVKTFTIDSPRLERLVPLIYQKSSIQQRNLIVLEKIGDRLEPDKIFSPIKNFEDHGPSTENRMEIYKREAPRLALGASLEAIQNSNIQTSEIQHLITVSCTGFSAPGFDISLMKEIGLSNSVSRTHIGFMGCHGAFNGFRVAQALASASGINPSTVLLTAVELCSIHVAYGSEPSRIVANALFSDGASSALFSNERPKKPAWQLKANGSYLFPDSEDLMGWEIGNHGFRMNLSPEIPKAIEAHLKVFISNWLSENHLSVSEIESWAVHPGGPKILDAVESSLHLKPNALDVSRGILANYGNMSSATILYIVDELIQKNFQTPCVALGFGPGLHVEIALFI